MRKIMTPAPLSPSGPASKTQWEGRNALVISSWVGWEEKKRINYTCYFFGCCHMCWCYHLILSGLRPISGPSAANLCFCDNKSFCEFELRQQKVVTRTNHTRWRNNSKIIYFCRLSAFAIGMVGEVCSKAILIHAEVLIASDILTLSTRFCAGYWIYHECNAMFGFTTALIIHFRVNVI